MKKNMRRTNEKEGYKQRERKKDGGLEEDAGRRDERCNGGKEGKLKG